MSVAVIKLQIKFVTYSPIHFINKANDSVGTKQGLHNYRGKYYIYNTGKYLGMHVCIDIKK